MPNRRAHNTAGAICGTFMYLIIQKNEIIDIGELILSAGIGFGSARIPDILEPPINPNHRDFFHSFVFGVILGLVATKTWQDLQYRRNERKILGLNEITMSEIIDIILIVGVCSILLHMFMDSFTTKGLPFI